MQMLIAWNKPVHVSGSLTKKSSNGIRTKGSAEIRGRSMRHNVPIGRVIALISARVHRPGKTRKTSRFWRKFNTLVGDEKRTIARPTISPIPRHVQWTHAAMSPASLNKKDVDVQDI